MHNDNFGLNSDITSCGLMDSHNSMNYTHNSNSPFYMGSMECNSFNMHCNPASPWYEGEKNKSTGDDFDIKKYQSKQSNPKALFIISIIGMLFLYSTVFFAVFCAMFVITTIYGVVQYWQSKNTTFETKPN